MSNFEINYSVFIFFKIMSKEQAVNTKLSEGLEGGKKKSKVKKSLEDGEPEVEKQSLEGGKKKKPAVKKTTTKKSTVKKPAVKKTTTKKPATKKPAAKKTAKKSVKLIFTNN